MAAIDPIARKFLQLESRRFVARCEGQLALIQRADSLREVSRLATMPLPYSLTEDQAARESQRQVTNTAEDRARELIAEQIARFAKAEPLALGKLKRIMLDDWANLTGPLGHLRPWALSRLNQAEQALQDPASPAG
jgi:hypothetical protein